MTNWAEFKLQLLSQPKIILLILQKVNNQDCFEEICQFLKFSLSKSVHANALSTKNFQEKVNRIPVGLKQSLTEIIKVFSDQNMI